MHLGLDKRFVVAISGLIGVIGRLETARPALASGMISEVRSQEACERSPLRGMPNPPAGLRNRPRKKRQLFSSNNVQENPLTLT